ncbi:coiled-coil domain-containing protein 186 isoform X2 [Anthonomus grandis grandis]|uniref:coiled-coil domain-containing protein 186 isoform X2 n=1 Tax=Anthonomus grandis grandis TaxID=2921223 RepID=UPI0021656E09|nr:coiled-coil domain-containing protein 186 isoform X2 [Anthonomus grandis grandis]
MELSETCQPENAADCASPSEENLDEENPFNNSSDSPNEEQESKNVNELLEKLAYQQRIIEQNADTIRFLEEKNTKQENLRKELECMLENATKQKEAATKEKENMVIRYAVGEKNVIRERQQKEQAEKKLKDAQKEIQLFQQKMQTMVSEKARICQMLDNKCYEHKSAQQELEKVKQDLNNVETKLKWHQSSLKTEIEAHRDCQAKVESLNGKLQDYQSKIESAKKNAEETVQNFMTSQENKAYVLDQQVKELQASLILLRHEKSDRDQQIKVLQNELDRLQSKQKEIIDENNSLSQKVQQLERERSESEQKLSEMRNCQDQQRQDAANLQTRNVQLEQLKLQLKHEQEQLMVANQQIELFKQRNQEIDTDIESCRIREAELLLFTQQLTDKNVRLQSEFTSMETKVQQLLCEQAVLKRQLKEQETKYNLLSATLDEHDAKSKSENENLRKTLEETQYKLNEALREVADEKGENMLIKRKYELSLKEVNKELQHARRKIESYESGESSTSTSSSGSSLNVNSQCHNSSDSDHVKVVSPDATIDKQTLIEHIVKLQRISAKKSEKIDFLEEHINSLVLEIQKKAKLLQGYAAMDQNSILSSNRTDSKAKDNRAQLARLNGIMASMYSNKNCDETLTLELSLDINRKLQAVLEDALMKNITLTENVDTLGTEIDRLNQLLKKS